MLPRGVGWLTRYLLAFLPGRDGRRVIVCFELFLVFCFVLIGIGGRAVDDEEGSDGTHTEEVC